MKTYIGTKIIQALAMTRAAYNDYRGWKLPENEVGEDEGYLVEYLDGGKPNDARHAGYISWSPKAQFDAAYIDIGDVAGYAPHQQRVIAEKAELDDRLNKLVKFFPSDLFASLDPLEQERMHAQAAAMTDYSNCLAERVAFFAA